MNLAFGCGCVDAGVVGACGLWSRIVSFVVVVVVVDEGGDCCVCICVHITGVSSVSGYY